LICDGIGVAFPGQGDIAGIMVVLQVLPALISGGVERGTVEITEAIVRAGGTALVASAGGPMVAAVERAGGRHIRLPLMTRDPVNILVNARKLARVIEVNGVGLVHARSRAPAWSAWIAGRRTGTPFVTTYHGAYSEGFPFKRLYNSVMARGDRVIAISDFIARLIAERHGVGRERVRVIPRGVDPAIFDPALVTGDRVDKLARAWRVPDGAYTVVLPGRLSGWKGHSVVLEAVAKLNRADICCVFVGRGKRRAAARLTAHAETLGIATQLRIVGHVDDMPAAMMLSDVVVHASVEPEGFGRVVIEAQAMGRPVIASDLGGPAETVENGVTGWLVVPGDVDQLAATIHYALALDDDARAALGAQAREAVLERYTTWAMQDATVAVYAELLGLAPQEETADAELDAADQHEHAA
jgi:glycosyltransferase involved in cell wall biosynthesis